MFQVDEDSRQTLSIQNGRMIELLCQVLNINVSLEDQIELFELLSDEEWSALYQRARQQGFSPLLYRRLKDFGDAVDVPESIMAMLHQDMLTATTRNMLMLHGAGLILRTLRSQNLDVIPLKGLYLVENVYRDISLRSFSDLDLLVHKEDLDAVIACMQELGYNLETYYSTQDANRDIKHVPPMSKSNGLLIEIHWTILEEHEPFTINADGLWTRAVPASVAGEDVLSLSKEDLLLHLCIHLGYQHHFKVGLRGLFDVVEVLQYFTGQENWQKMTETATQWGVERVIWLVLKLVVEIFGTEIPQDVFDHLMAEAVPDKVLTDARLQLITGEERVMVMTPDLARLTTTQGFGAKVKVMLSRVFIPRRVLARVYNVSPNSPTILWCYFRRFRDLVKQYGHAIKPVLSKDQAIMKVVAEEQSSTRLAEWMGKVR